MTENTNLISRFRRLSQKRKILIILTVGLVIRLLLMPFFGHEDIFLTNARAYSVAFEGINLFSFNQQISHFIEVINLKVYSVFFDFNQLLPFSTSSLDNPYILRNLFFFKLPYLLFDILAAWLVLKIVPTKQRVYAFTFYFLNPILIFAVYIFGRYESFPIVFLLLVILLLKRKKALVSALIMGLTILVRSSMLMVLPFYWATVGKNWKEKFTAIIVSVVPYILVLLYQVIGLGNTNELQFVTNGTHTNFILGLEFQLNEVIGANFYPLIATYGVLLFLAFWLWLQKGQSWKLTAGFFGMGFALYFVLGFYHPQYVAWIIPFIAILLMDAKFRQTTLLAFSAIVLAYPFMMLLWGQPILMGVLRPASEALGTKDLGGVISNFYSQFKLADLARSFMSGMFLILGYNFARPIISFLRQSDN